MSDKARKEMGGEEQLQQVLKDDKIQGKKNETKQGNSSLGKETQKH